MKTLEEIKTRAATLSAEERNELAMWLSTAKDVWEIRRDQLRQEIELGLAEIERGEAAPLDMEEIKRKARLSFHAQHGPLTD